ncbi:MAG TPA: bifunctional UDP-sugar hydrolase/5'-nucleotidase [Chloroflexota bacterium]|nr:bifunctional UDP-sugar hydrolase/5'-nucleotidase [Chloroflexota bacterium]
MVAQLLALVAVVGPAPASGQAGRTTIVILHTSDYHSHAPSHYSEGEFGMGGLARAIRLMRDERARNPNTVILSGGDTMNAGTPAWSDKYQCAEWQLFNGLQDAMAFGNHELDYGWQRFQDCRASIDYPVLSANFLGQNGQPVLPGWVVLERGGIRLGIFALAGGDFEKLVRPVDRPPDSFFSDGLAAALQTVQYLRETEKVNAVVLIGHRAYEEDQKLAREVPGIDLILGTHSHRKEPFGRIEGSDTFYISPFQYLDYVSRVELSFEAGRLSEVNGDLVRMDSSHPEDPGIAALVARMQAELQADPKYAPRFEKLGQAAVELSDAGIGTGETVLGNFVMDTIRAEVGAHAALSTASSFRAAIPPGDISVEDYLTAVPYKNVVLVHELSGSQLQALLDLSVARRGTDNFSQVSGVRFAIREGKAAEILVLVDPTNPAAGFAPLQPDASYQVATTDFQARIAAGYSDIFKTAAGVRDTGIVVNDLMMAKIRASSPVRAELDGRIRS